MSRRARPGTILKLARRQLLRTAGSSVLVASLIAVPVAGAVAALTFVESGTPTPQQAVTLELGETQSWIQIIGGPDPSREQAIDTPWMTTEERDENGEATNPELPPPGDLEAAGLPAGTETIPLINGGARIETRDGIASFTVMSGESWDPRLEGRFEVLSGETPNASDEAMASPELLERLGLKVGDDAVLPDDSRTLRIVGTMRALDASSYPSEMLFTTLPKNSEPLTTVWFLPDWQPGQAELSDLNHAGYVAYARDLVLDPPPDAMTGGTYMSAGAKWGIIATISVAATFAAVLVGLLSAAAMSVSARRQQRSLAVVATVGARRSDVFRVVLVQGAALGLAGGVIGGILGISGVAAIIAIMGNGVKNTFWPSWGLSVPWSVLVAMLLAVVVGVIASLAPARGATHGDVLAALRGARRPVRMSRRQPRWGIVVLLVGIGLIAAAGVSLAASTYENDWGAGSFVMLWGLIIGILLLLAGVILTGQGILAGLARVLPVFGPAARLASRDAVANSSRTVPAFVAIAASVTVAAFVLCALTLFSAETMRNYAWQGPKGSINVTGWGDTIDEEPAFLDDSGAEQIVAVSITPEPALDEEGMPVDDQAETISIDVWADGRYGAPVGWHPTCCQGVSVVEPDDVEALTGFDLTADELKSFAAGGIIATSADNASPDDTISISYWDPTDFYGMWNEEPTPLRTFELPADVHTEHSTAWPVILSPAAAAELNIKVETHTWVALFDEGAPVAVQDRAMADAETAVTDTGGYSIYVEKGPDSMIPWLLALLAGASTIVIAASAISLGLARIERREDDATLAAVGATTRVRRAIGAWQALIIAGVGCLVGVGIAIIGAWALTQALATNLRMADLPFWWLLALGVGLPAVIAVVSLAIRPQDPTLTRRTAIA